MGDKKTIGSYGSREWNPNRTIGSQLHKKDYVDVGTPIITVEHLGDDRIIHKNLPRVSDADKERLNRYWMSEGDIIFSRVGSVDRRALVREEEDGWLFSGRCLRVRPLETVVDPVFLSYFIGQERFLEHIRRIAVGATMPSINTKILSDVEIILPSLPEQRRIARILGSLDAKIELNRRMNATLEAMARALFKSWFVDFDPVRAKLDGRPTRLPAEIEALFPDGFEESELGKIPKWWEVAALTEVADVLSGGTPSTKKPEYWNGEIDWVSATDVSNASLRFVLHTERKISKLGLEKSSAKILPKNTTVITARGTVGNICLLGADMAMNQTNYGLRAKDGRSHFFLFFVMANLIGALQMASYGTIFDTITTRTLNTTRIVLPNANVLNAFETYLAPLLTRMLSNQMEQTYLSHLRDALLPRLMRGELL